MADELKIWALGEGSAAEAVESVASVALEGILEETLVRRPEMLETGLHLVGRQTPTEGGPLDLLGVDAGGRLVVYELKREKLTREAVTQCIDYASALDTMTPEELAEFIAEQSGSDGIDEIEDFDDWYEERFPENDPGDLVPPRLVLVGLGVDERAERMARFLSEGGIDIAVLTFYGFLRGGETLLARQVEVERDTAPASKRHRWRSAAEKRQELYARLAEREWTDLFNGINAALREEIPGTVQQSGSWGITYCLTANRSRRGFFRLGVAEAGLQLHWLLQPNYDDAAREKLAAEAEQSGWQLWPNHSRYVLDIANEAGWNEQHASVVEFLKRAQASWSAAASDETAGEESTP